MAFVIRVRSWYTIRPAPIFKWPTSELPITPSGRPTARPLASPVKGTFPHPAVHHRRVRQRDGIVFRLIGHAVAIEDEQHSRFLGDIPFRCGWQGCGQQQRRQQNQKQ